jgi:hypothetical protein
MHPGDVLVYIGQSTIDLDNLTKRLMWFLLLKVAFSKSRELKTVSQSTRPWAAIPIMLSKIKIWRKPSGPSTLHTENYINDFAEGLDLSATAFKSEPPFLINILRQMWQRDHDQTNISFYSMPESTQMQLATDPRDKIYALLGMTIKSEGAELNIPINYSCSLEQCFTKATQSLLRISLNVLLLVNTAGYDSQNGKLPSWVPEFIRERDFASIWISTNWHCFNAAPGDGPCHISFHWQGNTDCIELKAIHVATVTATCLTTFKALSTENPPCYAKLFQYQYNRALRILSSRSHPRYWPMTKEGKSRISLQNTSWASVHVEPDDILVIAHGLTVSFLLRKHEETYRFVGACILIDKQDRGKVGKDGVPFLPEDCDDPCYSDIMRGGAWKEHEETLARTGKGLEQNFVIC